MAIELAKRGADVVLTARNSTKAEHTRRRLAAEAPTASASIFDLDLQHLSSARAFAQRVKASVTQLDVLVLNAGIMAVPYRSLMPHAHIAYRTILMDLGYL